VFGLLSFELNIICVFFLKFEFSELLNNKLNLSEKMRLENKKFSYVSKIIAVNIRDLRTRKSISKRRMAELLHCSYSAYCRLEAGETELINPKLSKNRQHIKCRYI